MRVIEKVFRLTGKGVLASAEAARKEYLHREYPAPAPVPRGLRKACEVREEQIHGNQVFTLTPRESASGLHVLYTHGGGYVHPLMTLHWSIIRKLIESTGATVTAPIYPLAPEHTWAEAYSLLEEVYRRIIGSASPLQVILCGDSAGGGLALGQAILYRDKGLPLPGRIMLFSPWLDITMSNPSAAATEKEDVILTAAALTAMGRMWAGEDDRRSPLLSPIFGDLSGLPPIDVFQGTHDIFIGDARLLARKVKAAGGEIDLHEYPGAFHVFVAAIFTPEARDAFQSIAQTAAARTLHR